MVVLLIKLVMVIEIQRANLFMWIEHSYLTVVHLEWSIVIIILLVKMACLIGNNAPPDEMSDLYC